MLRPLRSDDAWRIADLINDFDVARMLTRVPFPFSLADAEGFVQRVTGADDGNEQVFAVDHREFGLIGVLGLTRKGGLFPELGYWLGRTFWGRGFATEAASALVRFAAEAQGARALMAGHYADNPASGRVLEKAGFLYTGAVQPRHSLARGEIASTRMMVWLA